MKPPFSPALIAALVLLLTLGIPLGLYALLTRGRRRSMREIGAEAGKHGWRFQRRRWSGNPTAFRIDGRTPSGLDWILKTIGAGSESYSPGWNAELELRFPMLAGEVDFAILPVKDGDRSAPKASLAAQTAVAAVSATLAGAVAFFRDASHYRSGAPAFDAAYQVLALPGKFAAPIDPELAARIMDWPQEAVVPHSVLAWRDPFGFHFLARLPAPANWATVEYAVALAERLASRLPAGSTPPADPKLVDRVIAQLQK